MSHYFADAVNNGYAELDASAVDRLSDSECDSCSNIIVDIERLRRGATRVTGLRFKLESVEAAPADIDGSVIVDVRFTSDPYIELDSSGVLQRSEPAQVDQDAQVKLVPQDRGWLVYAIRTV